MNPNDPQPPEPIKGLAEVKPESVVSRSLLKKETGNVTFFAFDQGQEISAHTAPFEALVFLVEGEADIRVDDASFVVKAGELLHLPAGRPHALKAITPFKMILVMIRS